jgi:hypothetical protein
MHTMVLHMHTMVLHMHTMVLHIASSYALFWNSVCVCTQWSSTL